MKRFNKFHLIFLLTLAGLAFVVQPGMAAPPGPTPPGGHLNIIELPSVDKKTGVENHTVANIETLLKTAGLGF